MVGILRGWSVQPSPVEVHIPAQALLHLMSVVAPVETEACLIGALSVNLWETPRLASNQSQEVLYLGGKHSLKAAPDATHALLWFPPRASWVLPRSPHAGQKRIVSGSGNVTFPSGTSNRMCTLFVMRR